ncbi:hypothetical protein J2Z50_006597 [Ensifer mexicanus]|nr:hypothetical protein [Sinorhizobium mexicanum]
MLAGSHQIAVSTVACRRRTVSAAKAEPGLKTKDQTGAFSERWAKKVVRNGTGRYEADAIWAADQKLRCADMTNQRAMIGGVACDDNFAELGCLVLWCHRASSDCVQRVMRSGIASRHTVRS